MGGSSSGRRRWPCTSSGRRVFGLTTARPKEPPRAGAALRGPRSAGGRRGNCRTLLWVLLASVAACLINPNHIHAFTLPSGARHVRRRASGSIARDEQFQSLFCSPFESHHFYPRIGLNVAGLAFFPLVPVLGLIFAPGFAQWVGRWSWERAFVWIAFFALAAWRPWRGHPILRRRGRAGIAALNFDFVLAASSAASAVTGRAGTWAVGGRPHPAGRGRALPGPPPGRGWPGAAAGDAPGGWTVEPDLRFGADDWPHPGVAEGRAAAGRTVVHRLAVRPAVPGLVLPRRAAAWLRPPAAAAVRPRARETRSSAISCRSRTATPVKWTRWAQKSCVRVTCIS